MFTGDLSPYFPRSHKELGEAEGCLWPREGTMSPGARPKACESLVTCPSCALGGRPQSRVPSVKAVFLGC